jgi:hypothetical protein
MHRLYATLIVSVFVLSLGIVVNVHSVAAQTTGSATLRGTVKDPQGAVLRDAAITLVNERASISRWR